MEFPEDYRRVEKLISGHVNFNPDRELVPCIRDFYHARASDMNKNLTYQKGLSNYSNLVLGDDRLFYETSFNYDAFHKKIEGTAVEDDGLTVSDRDRQRLYKEANRRIPKKDVDGIEKMIREKLNQRTTSGPFQLRKTFKYFDRDGSGDIDFSEMRYAFKIMGFSFTDMQVLALFARYDGDGEGSIDYQEFIDNLMEKDFTAVGNNYSLRKKLTAMILDEAVEPETEEGKEEVDYDSDFDEEDQIIYEIKEVKQVFAMLDTDLSGYIDIQELRLLLLALGREMSDEEIGHLMAKYDDSGDSQLAIDEFLDWWFEKHSLSKTYLRLKEQGGLNL